MSRRIIITGATGFIGKALCRHLSENNYEVIALSRNPDKSRLLFGEGITVAGWDGKSSNSWGHYADGAFGIVNLAGENIGTGRWNSHKKELIKDSRLNAGTAVIDAVRNVPKKPEVLIQASAAGYYNLHSDKLTDEYSRNGDGFLSEVCRQWESSTKEAEFLGIRHITIRTGVVLGKSGGILPRLLMQYRMFLGGYFGSGRQWFSWIHINDEIRAIRFLLEQKISGIFNLTSPNPVTMKDFCHTLGESLKRPSWLPIPSPLIQLLFGEMGRETLLASQRVVPKRLLEKGFDFFYPDLKSALEEIIHTEK